MDGESCERDARGTASWERPAFEEIKMDAEIGAYQSDDGGYAPAE